MVLCSFYQVLQIKILLEYVLLKVVKLLFQKQTLLHLPYNLVASYLTSILLCTLLTSYFLSQTRKLFFSKIHMQQCYFS